jgi:hypothetical protein
MEAIFSNLVPLPPLTPPYKGGENLWDPVCEEDVEFMGLGGIAV